MPTELEDLSDAEKMLIQRVSPFIPLYHIKNETFGIKVHVCSFPQEISSICQKLPRLPSDVTVVKLVHTFQREISGDMCNRVFKVRKQKVLTALHWLKKYHKGYSDIEICDTNMDWMQNNSEAQLPVTEYVSENIDIIDEDLGP